MSCRCRLGVSYELNWHACRARGETLATIHKALVGLRDRCDIDVEGGEGMKARGNVVDHEYEIKRDGDMVASISKKWFRIRDTYGIDIVSGEDEPLILALAVALDEMTHDSLALASRWLRDVARMRVSLSGVKCRSG